jgi:hypothetical protein
MGRMGASTGYPVTGVTVAQADRSTRIADKDLLILGSPGRSRCCNAGRSRCRSRRRRLAHVPALRRRFKVEDWWHGERGVERAPARADLSLVSSNGDALLTGFESPLQKDRSAVALISAAGQSDADLSAALLDNRRAAEIQGAMAVIHGRT